jgi:hypothetical protein
VLFTAFLLVEVRTTETQFSQCPLNREKLTTNRLRTVRCIYETKHTKQCTEVKQLMSKADGVINVSPDQDADINTQFAIVQYVTSQQSPQRLTIVRTSTSEYRSDKYTNDSTNKQTIQYKQAVCSCSLVPKLHFCSVQALQSTHKLSRHHNQHNTTQSINRSINNTITDDKIVRDAQRT